MFSMYLLKSISLAEQQWLRDKHREYIISLSSVLHAKQTYLQVSFKDKPIFHWKQRSRWLSNSRRQETNKMKSTWPTPALRVGDPTPPIFHLLVLEVGVGGNANFRVCFGVTQILVFLDTNMLVSPMRNCGVGGLSQCVDPTRMVLRRSGI